jgi:hypothetical protein
MSPERPDRVTQGQPSWRSRRSAVPYGARGRRDEDNINKRVLKPVLERADEVLADRDQHLPRGVTPHKLRHTYASVLIALGRDPRYVMEQLGHTDPKFTLRVCAHAMRFSEEDRPAEGSRGGPRLGTNGHWHPREGLSGTWVSSGRGRRVSSLRPLACEERGGRRSGGRKAAVERDRDTRRSEPDSRELRPLPA